ncbi:rhomboid family intramembrane serine protease [Candidatus Neptunochlamydia vexilliferae]|nr:rhomboid family intramembrane serine protease [Candidatus Neptunochlamydia vexilliferae]
MRLLGTLEGEKEALRFYSFLKGEEIDCTYDPVPSSEGTYEFWVVHEDKIEQAAHWLSEFKKNPNDPRFDVKEHPIDTEGVAEEEEKEPVQLRALQMRQRVRSRMPLTRLIVIICALLYIWNGYQMADIAKEDPDQEMYSLTPLMTDLSYDMPTAASRAELSKKIFSEDRIGNPTVWDGLYEVVLGWPESKGELDAPLFVQIRQGEVWRLITPCFLHGSFLHILFNMLWLWMLGRQVEERTKKWQYILISLIIGIVSNTFQYLMSGPLFIGYSGIVCGLAGFIWMRQRRAPWEGYPLQRGTLIFLAVFVVGMVSLQVASFFLIRFQIANFSMNIANTAHISGALTGIVLGRIPFFSKGGV